MLSRMDMEIPSERREDDVLLALTCEVSGDLGRLFEHVVKKTTDH